MYFEKLHTPVIAECTNIIFECPYKKKRKNKNFLNTKFSCKYKPISQDVLYCLRQTVKEQKA